MPKRQQCCHQRFPKEGVLLSQNSQIDNTLRPSEKLLRHHKNSNKTLRISKVYFNNKKTKKRKGTKTKRVTNKIIPPRSSTLNSNHDSGTIPLPTSPIHR